MAQRHETLLQQALDSLTQAGGWEEGEGGAALDLAPLKVLNGLKNWTQTKELKQKVAELAKLADQARIAGGAELLAQLKAKIPMDRLELEERLAYYKGKIETEPEFIQETFKREAQECSDRLEMLVEYEANNKAFVSKQMELLGAVRALLTDELELHKAAVQWALRNARMKRHLQQFQSMA